MLTERKPTGPSLLSSSMLTLPIWPLLRVACTAAATIPLYEALGVNSDETLNEKANMVAKARSTSRTPRAGALVEGRLQGKEQKSEVGNVRSGVLKPAASPSGKGRSIGRVKTDTLASPA